MTTEVTGDRRPLIRSCAVLAALLALVLLLWFPGVLVGGVISTADALFAFPPWEAERPADYRGPSNKLLFDQVAQVHPWADLARRRLQSLELPLWNPHTALGTAFLANQNVGLLSPVHLPLWLATSTAIGLTWVALLKLALALSGTWALARTLGVSRRSTPIAALTYATGAQMLVWLGHPLTTALPFLPWSLCLAERCVGPERKRLDAPALALVTAAHLFGSHPESSLHIVASTALYTVVRTGIRRETLPEMARVAAAMMLGILITAPQMLPFVAALGDSYPAAMRHEHVSRWTMPAALLPLAWAPNLYGTPQELNHRETLAGGWNYAESALFAGVLPLVLIPAFWRRVVADPARRALATLGGTSLVVALDPFGLISRVLHPIPLIGLGAHQRMTVVWTLTLAVLLAAAVDALLDSGADHSRAATYAAVIAGVSAVSWGVTRLGSADALSTRPLVYAIWATLLLGVAAVLIGQRRRLSPSALLPVATLATVADLWLFGAGFNPVADPALVFPPTGTTTYLSTVGDGQRVVALGRAAPPNTLLAYGIDDMRGYEPLFRDDLQRFWWQAVGPRGVWEELHWGEISSAPALRLLGVGYVVDHPKAYPIDGGALGLQLVHDADARIYRVRDPMPRAFVRREWSVVSSAAEAGKRIRDGLELERWVTLDRVPSPTPRRELEGSVADTVLYRRPAAEEIIVEVALSAPGIVVVSEGYDPGFRATVDGHRVELLKAYGVLQAVAVAEGRHVVRLSYVPRGLELGIGISLASLISLALISASRWNAPTTNCRNSSARVGADAR